MLIQVKLLYILSTITIISLVYVNCLDRQANARRINNSGTASARPKQCGNDEEISKKVGLCLKPLFELIEGKYPKVPTTDSEIIPHCERFATCEKCLRAVAKDCLTGLHKTAVGAFASSTGRFKRQECKSEALRSNFKDSFKCTKAKGDEIAQVYKDVTGIAQAIRDLPVSAEEKTIKLCCLLKVTDDRLSQKFNAYCPDQTQKILDIVHSVTDDAKSTLCLNPKCQGALNSVMSAKYKPGQSFIEPVMQILLLISTE